MHVIHLPASTKTVRLGQYVQAWKDCKAAPVGTEYNHGLCGWSPTTRERILREFEEGMHDRINRHTEGYGVGRKWDSDYQRGMAHAARAVNTARLIVRYVPADLRKRLAHRLYNEEE